MTLYRLLRTAAATGLLAVVAFSGGCRERPEVTEPEPSVAPSESVSAADTAQAAPSPEPAPEPAPEPVAAAPLPAVSVVPEAPPPPASASAHKPKFPRKSAVYDPAGPAYELLQAPAQALSRFPADSLGNIDWMAALRAGLIRPRASLRSAGTMQVRANDIIMRDTRDMPWVRFPHRAHSEWLACSNCHPRLFKEEAGATDITMETIMRGEHCGQCHDRVAFSIFVCERCHSIVHEGSPKAWW